MTGFWLKIIAAVTMFIDHAGLLLFPAEHWMRIVGRIAYPLFAWSIAEGFRYTRNRMRYFLQIFLLGVGCQIVYTIAEGELYFGILLTFSFSIAIMGALRETKAAFLGENTAFGDWLGGRGVTENLRRVLTSGLLFGSLLVAAVTTITIKVDYGFCGILVPVFSYLPDKPLWRKISCGVMLGALSAVQWSLGDTTQIWCFLAMIPLMLYNGKPGRYRMKWFFYIFYPVHMAFLYLLSVVF